MVFEKKFINERGNSIVVRIEDENTNGVNGVLIYISGPDSDTENHVTLEEAKVIHELLGIMLKNSNI